MKLILNTKVTCWLLILFIFTFILILYFNTDDQRRKVVIKRPYNHLKLSTREDTWVLKEKIVHLDLKGAPPRVSYYSELFPLLKKLGATGVLMEYEDMFPFRGPLLNNISAYNAYTIKDITTINNLARQHRLKVIPFIQVLSHLDFVLKLEKYLDYRKVWNLPSVICPSYNKTLTLLRELIEQVVDAHPDSNMIHIGCDEVSHLGHCQHGTGHIIVKQLTKNELFLGHIHSVIDIITRKNPSMQVLMWDDHFRTSNLEEVQLYNSLKPIVRWYGKDVYDELGPSLWNIYSSVFPKVWVASAYKGGIGSNKYISDANHYIQNHKSWLSVIDEYHKKLSFEGIILMGRQRYDHFAALCELLPVGIPALAMSLRLLQGFKDSALGPPLEVAKILECEQPYGLIGSAFGSPKCKFPGGNVLENIVHFHQLQQEFEEMTEDSRIKGWLTEYNKAYSFSNPHQVKSALTPIDKIKSELELLKGEISNSMLEIYDRFTIDEWLETYLLPFEKQVSSLWQAKQRILAKTYWPRRPVNFNGYF